MSYVHTWKQQLARTPYPEPVAADAVQLPYRSIADYHAMGAFARSWLPAPVLVGYFQYYRLLTDVIALLQNSLAIDGPVLVEISRPLGVALPLELLSERVLVSDDTARQAHWWSGAEVDRFVQVRSRIRRDLHEFGDNSLSVVLHSRVDDCDPLPDILRQAAFADAFRPLDHAAAATATNGATGVMECTV